MFQQPKHISQLITEVVVYYHRVELLTQQRVASNLCMRPNPDNLYQLTKIQTASKCSKPPGSPSSCNIPPPPRRGLLYSLGPRTPAEKSPPGLFSPNKRSNFSRYSPQNVVSLLSINFFSPNLRFSDNFVLLFTPSSPLPILFTPFRLYFKIEAALQVTLTVYINVISFLDKIVTLYGYLEKSKNGIIKRKRSSGFCRIFSVAFDRLFQVR